MPEIDHRLIKFLQISSLPCLAMFALAAGALTDAGSPTPNQPPRLGADAMHSPLSQPTITTTAPSEMATFTTTDFGAGTIHTGATTDRGSVLVEQDGRVWVELVIESDHQPNSGTRMPTDLVVIMDHSGSMSGQKMADAKAAARGLIGQLSDTDRFSLVRFSSGVDVTIPLQHASAWSRELWSGQIGLIYAGGSTNMAAGLEEGLAQLSSTPGRVGRAILISDGLPDSHDGLHRLARQATIHETPLTTVGIGNDYDETLMSGLADSGTGNFYWVEQQQDLAQIFAAEFDTARETVATSVRVSLDTSSGVQLVDAAGYVIDHDQGSSGFALGSLYAGQRRSLWVEIAVPTQNVGTLDLGALQLELRSPLGELSTAAVHLPQISVVDDQASFVANIDSDVWGRGLVTEKYNSLRKEVSQWVQAGDRDRAIALLDDYTTEVEALNAEVGSAQVTSNLGEVAQLKQEVTSQFEGENQRGRQNVWAKTLNMRSYSSRRSGQSRLGGRY